MGRLHGLKVKVKVKVRTLDLAPLRETPPQKCSGMARVLKGSQFYIHTHTFIRSRNEPYLLFAFQAIADTHLPTPEGWKAELAWSPWCLCTSPTPHWSGVEWSGVEWSGGREVWPFRKMAKLLIIVPKMVWIGSILTPYEYSPLTYYDILPSTNCDLSYW